MEVPRIYMGRNVFYNNLKYLYPENQQNETSELHFLPSVLWNKLYIVLDPWIFSNYIFVKNKSDILFGLNNIL